VVIVATRFETRTDAGLAGEHDACRAPPFLTELQYAIEHFVVRLGDDDLASHCVPGSIQERKSFFILPEGHNVGKFLLRLEGVSKPLVVEFLDWARFFFPFVLVSLRPRPICIWKKLMLSEYRMRCAHLRRCLKLIVRDRSAAWQGGLTVTVKRQVAFW